MSMHAAVSDTPNVAAQETADLSQMQMKELLQIPGVERLLQLGMAQAVKQTIAELEATEGKRDQLVKENEQLKGQLRAAFEQNGSEVATLTSEIERLNGQIKNLQGKLKESEQLREVADRASDTSGSGRSSKRKAKADSSAATLDGTAPLVGWFKAVFTNPRKIAELCVLLAIIGSTLRIWVINADFSLDGLASWGVIPNTWIDAPSIDIIVLGKVTTFHTYQLIVSMVEVLFTPFYWRWGTGWPIKLRKQEWYLTLTWVIAFLFLDLGTAFRGLSNWMSTGITWRSYVDITLPTVGILHLVSVLALGSAMCYIVEPVVTQVVIRIRRLPSITAEA